MQNDALLDLLSKSLDEDLTREEQDLLNDALNHDESLRMLKMDLVQQKKLVQAQVPEPSKQVYDRLLTQIRFRYPKSKSRWRFSLGYLATAALVILAFGAGYFLKTPVRNPDQAVTSNLTLQLLQTRAAYVDAIGRLEEMAEDHIRQMPPEVAAQVEENLRIVNHAIVACESFAQAYPDQLIAFTSLAQAYQAKVDLLQTLVYGANRRS